MTDEVAHYSSKRNIEHSRKTGEEVAALCGVRFVAKHTHLPICPTCQDLLKRAVQSSSNLIQYKYNDGKRRKDTPP